MKLSLIKPEDAISEAYLKQSVKRPQIETFKNNLSILFSRINESESEEYNKNIISDFLKDTYYKHINEINTHKRKDMVIHNGPKHSDAVGVIIEAKKPSNKNEMISLVKPNAKALHELMSYYLTERYLNNNKEIKHLVITNIWEWYIFDAADFEKFFYENKKLVKSFKDWHDGVLVGTKTDWFYEEVAKPFIDKELTGLSATYFDLKKVKEIIINDSKEDDEDLVTLYKLLSGEYLLKKQFANDSNRLNKDFYNELLYIIGLEEIKDKGKKIIDRKAEGKRDDGSLLENTINILTVRNKLNNLENPRQFGETNEQQLYSLALELCINWLNRILFLKLLEGQLKQYHKKKNSQDYKFLNADKVGDYDELDELFFEVLALEPSKRSASVNTKFGNIPYLNSSLFEISELESKTIQIGSLKGRLEIPLYGSSVLKENEKRLTGNKNTLHYLFEFLEAYDFASDGSQLIQEEEKSIINASVLGLIFEKINGYKDGSFFTPGFITMYMCRETIRRAVVQKFKEDGGKAFEKTETYEDLKDKIEHTDKAFRKKANDIINAIKICDPAVGSGHFLVSALNEIIAIKADLKILNFRSGDRLKGYKITVANDELVILNEETGKPFAYILNQQGKPIEELQELQETLFHEKQTLIENCLFGVDINPKSVTICRLRLWIELLKNAYYTNESSYKELETLPNIDINIKCGNSLISRFKLEDDLGEVFRSKKYSHHSYLVTVSAYKSTKNKADKEELKKFLEEIKKEFMSTVLNKHPYRKILSEKRAELTALDFVDLFGGKKRTEAETEKEKKLLNKEIANLDAKVEGYKNAAIFQNAFEWRFEFPEVLNNDGNYKGFDVVIGNPPYGNIIPEEQKDFFREKYISAQGPFEIYKFFIENSFSFLNKGGCISFITPDTWTNLSYFKKLRKFLFSQNKIISCSNTLYNVFEEATVDTTIFLFCKSLKINQSFTIISNTLDKVGVGELIEKADDFVINFKPKSAIIIKTENNTIPLDKLIEVWRGMSAYGAKDPLRPFNSMTKDSDFHRPLLNGGDIGKYIINWSGEHIKYGDWLHRPRPSFIYDKPHILIQRIRNPRLKERIIATLDNEKYISSDGLSNLILRNEYDNIGVLKYILATLNSKLINYWFSYYYFDVNIKPEQLRQIPIKEIDKKQQEFFIVLVDKILVAKKTNPQADTSDLEKEIDELVYKLYELTPEEIEIVKSTTK